MDIRQLMYFTEVAKQQSFTKAAHTLHVTQPTLSKMVRQLEAELSTTLLDRAKKKTMLTDAGEIVFERALKIIQMVDEVHLVLEDLEHLKKGHLKLGMPPLIGILFFPKLMKGFQQFFPQITFQLDEIGANVVKERVLSGDLDGGFVMLPAHDEDYDVLPFVENNVVAIVSKEHALSKVQQLSVSQLENESLLLFSEDFTLHDRIIQECQDYGFEPHIAFESSQWEFISQMVEHNLGIALFPEPFAEKVNHEKVCTIALEKPILWQIAFISKKNRYRSRAMQEFIHYIQKHSILESK